MTLKTKLVLLILMVVLFASYNVYARVNNIYLTSPFSYHIVKEVTELHLYDLARSISQRGYRVQFLNETEYSNIVHALEIRTGEFLKRGNELISYIAEQSSDFYLDLPLDAFLEDNNITDTSIWMYLRDIEGSFEDFTRIRQMNLGVKTEDGQTFDFSFTVGSNIKFLNFPPALSYQIHHNLLRSLEDLLRRENISPGHALTLYLKDLSLTNTFVDNYRDIERVNIGVIVEGKDGRYIKELDWIVEETKPQLVYTASSIINSVITSFHESAHELVRRALVGDMSIGVSLSIVPSIELMDGIWIAYGGVAGVVYSLDFSRTTQINKMAVMLAGEAAEEIIIRNDNYYDYVRIQADRENALLIAYIGICLGLGSWDRNVVEGRCPEARDMFDFSYQEWEEWKSDLRETQRQSVNHDANEWMKEAKLLARNVLIRNFRTLEDMTNLVLREGTLDTQDLENFYKNVSQITELESGTPIIQPPFLFNDTFQINVLNRNLSLLSSLVPISVENSRNANFQQVQNIENDTIEVLDGLKRVEVAENLRTYIRLEPMEYEVQLPYADGISSLYIKECIKIITDFYSHI